MHGSEVENLRVEITRCRACQTVLPFRPRPVVQIASTARIVIISQAPGRRVHDTGVPWNDASGQRLREWTGLTSGIFYDSRYVALVPMGLCYPGKGRDGDLPPRPECAGLWHKRIMACLPERRLTLLVGQYAQNHYLGPRLSVTARVQAGETLSPAVLALPHPSWRSTGWMQRNSWFAAETVPLLQRRVATALVA